MFIGLYPHPLKSQEHNNLLYNYDSIITVAQQFAQLKEYEKTRALCRYILDTIPSYSDVRLLLGRTYSWAEEYDSARVILKEVFLYSNIDSDNGLDAFNALTDVEYWSGNYNQAIFYCNEGLKSFPDDNNLLIKKAKSYKELGDFLGAKKILLILIHRNRENPDAIKLYNEIINSIIIENPDRTYPSFSEFEYKKIDNIDRLYDQAEAIAWDRMRENATSRAFMN